MDGYKPVFDVLGTEVMDLLSVQEVLSIYT